MRKLKFIKLKYFAAGIKNVFTLHTKDGPEFFFNPKENIFELVEMFAPGLFDLYEDKIQPIIENHRLKKCRMICEKAGCNRTEDHYMKFLDYWEDRNKKAACKMLDELHCAEMKKVTDNSQIMTDGTKLL